MGHDTDVEDLLYDQEEETTQPSRLVTAVDVQIAIQQLRVQFADFCIERQKINEQLKSIQDRLDEIDKVIVT
jgi:chaperonin cofactor prefoldin